MTPEQECLQVFLQEASERLQLLREYSGILQDPYPAAEDVDRLYVATHTLHGTSATYGFPLFAEIAGKLAHIFQYALNVGISQEAAAPLVEFISEAVAVLESDLLFLGANGSEAAEDIEAFKQRYPFAFQVAPELEGELAPASETTEEAAPEPVPVDWELPAESEVPGEILEFFVPEAEEHLQTVTDCLLALEASPNQDDVHRLFRAMHTIKGSAAQVGLQRIALVAHQAEELVGRLRDGELRPSAGIIDLCLETVDALKKFLYRQWDDDLVAQATCRALFARIAALTAGAEPVREVTEPPAETADVEASGVGLQEEESEDIAASPAVKKEVSAAPQSKSVRIALERLDRMMNAVGELVINRTRMLGRVAELERLADVLNFSKGRLSDKIGEFQEKYEFSRLVLRPLEEWVPETQHPNFGRRAADQSPFPSKWRGDGRPGHDDFSELELDRYDDFNILSRSLTEISADLTEVLTQLDVFVRRVDADIDEFSKLAHRLQDEITQARMVPISNLYTRISRTARDAAKAAGKQVELVLEGAETELDNNIIQQIADPLLHLVRNSVAHGIERAQERLQAGKPEQGSVAVRAYHRGNHIFIEVEDDGRGIDYERVRSTALELGLLDRERAAALGERELLNLLFHPGFSTAPRKSELAGRGVGLDVVRANLAGLNGEIEVSTELGRGTRFTLKVPLTLIISQALFVRCGEMTFAFPLAFVEEIRRLRGDDIEEVSGKLLTKVRDVVTEVVRLDTALGLPPVEPISGFYRLVLVNAGGRQVGIVVEDVLRKDEIVIKNLGEYLRNVKMFPGATIAPDGSLILLVDVNRLVAGDAVEYRPLADLGSAARIFAPGAAAVAAGSIPAEAMEAAVKEKLIVLADDSISVRKFVGRMLEKAGYRVRLASDGLEALEIAGQGGVDLVITDLEMPRTNGYELMAHLRQNLGTRDIPVMVVTSRAGAKHRERALQEGARAFETKPVQEEHLVAAVERLIGPGRSNALGTVAAGAAAAK